MREAAQAGEVTSCKSCRQDWSGAAVAGRESGGSGGAKVRVFVVLDAAAKL